MADFDPPFGQDGERRLPTATEREQGFLCGAASRALFNGLFNRIEAEIGEVINHAGIAPTDDRNTLLREAIEALIAAATGGGTVDDYILMTQARSRLPIFPEALTDDGKIVIISPEIGKVRVPGGTTFQHRGIYRVTTTQTDFMTDASKTYHLRWNATDGFAMKDLASGAYNPTAAAENNIAFDSTYDDMLVSRIITNSSNVATITNLVNKDRLYSSGRVAGVPSAVGSGALALAGAVTLNWSRAPKLAAINGNVKSSHPSPAGGLDGYAGYVESIQYNRYGASATVTTDWVTGAVLGSPDAYLDFNMSA